MTPIVIEPAAPTGVYDNVSFCPRCLAIRRGPECSECGRRTLTMARRDATLLMERAELDLLLTGNFMLEIHGDPERRSQ